MQYSAARIKEILKDIGIVPFAGNLVSSKQAAQIMTWRVKSEQGIAHEYSDTHVRRHISAGTLKEAGKLHERFKLFDARDIFTLHLMPQRSAGARKREAMKDMAKRPAVPPSDNVDNRTTCG